MESRQPTVIAMIKKRQLKFWQSLNKNPNTELYNLIERAKDTKYISYYKDLETQYNDPKRLFKEINDQFYQDTWKSIREATPEKSKIKLYSEIYNNAEAIPENSISLRCKYKKLQTVLSQYILSSYDLQCEKGRWARIERVRDCVGNATKA